MKVRFTQLWVIANFENKHFTMDAYECRRIFNYWVLQEFTATPVGENNVKIGYHVAKLEQKVAPFFRHGVQHFGSERVRTQDTSVPSRRV